MSDQTVLQELRGKLREIHTQVTQLVGTPATRMDNVRVLAEQALERIGRELGVTADATPLGSAGVVYQPVDVATGQPIGQPVSLGDGPTILPGGAVVTAAGETVQIGGAVAQPAEEKPARAAKKTE